MSRPVDVLAVMEKEARCMASYSPAAADQLLTAKKMVADLLDTATEYLTAQTDLDCHETSTARPDYAPLQRRVHRAREALDAALAKFGGAK